MFLRSVEELENYNELDYKLRKIDIDKYENTCDFYIEKLQKFSKHDKVVLDWVMKVLDKTTPKNLKFLYKDITLQNIVQALRIIFHILIKILYFSQINFEFVYILF